MKLEKKVGLKKKVPNNREIGHRAYGSGKGSFGNEKHFPKPRLRVGCKKGG